MTKPRPALWMLVTRLADGGAERLTVELACRLPARGYRVTVCTTRRHDETAAFQAAQAARLAAAGVELVSIDRRHRRDSLKMARLPRLLHSNRVDVLHTHLFHSNLWGTILGRVSGVPVIVAHEHGWSYGRAYRRLLDGLVIGRLASAFVVGSGWNRQRMIALERVPAEKCVLIPNAFFPRPGSDGNLRRELGLDDDVMLIGTVARLRAEKALDVLLEAFVRVRSERPGAHLVIAGDGALRANLERRARELGVAETTTFLGRREDVQAIVDALDVTVICSDFESTSLFALEAMTYGAVLVCTAVGGLRELLTDGVSGVLVPPRAPEELASAILRVAADAGLGKRLGAAARVRAGEFSAETLVTRYDELYRFLLATGRPRGMDRAR